MSTKRNIFIEKSITIAKEDYLDRLLNIYPMKEECLRTLSEHKKAIIKESIDKKDSLTLILELLKLELFPIKDSYIAFLKRSNSPESILINNPKTLKRLGDRLLAIGYEEIIQESCKPKETNRKIGSMFRNWLPQLGYKMESNENLILSSNEIVIHSGGDAKLKNFAVKHLGYLNKSGLEVKGLDLILKKGSKFLVAETKFLTDSGGHQNAQLNDAMSIFNCKFSSNVIPCAILDGVVWIQGNNKMHTTIINNSDKNILSALLLKELIESL